MPGASSENTSREAHGTPRVRCTGFAAVKAKVHEDMEASAEKLRAETDYAEQIARSATAAQKREIYERLAVHFMQLAAT
jgi:hypothetical protein